MSIRTITWAVAADGAALIPAVPQWGGVQGDDNAAEVRFVIPAECPLKGMSLYLETVDSTGAEDRTDVLFLHEDGVSHPVPLAWTQNGGTTTIRLVAENEGVVAYTLEAQIYFDNRQTGPERAAGLFRSEIQKALAEMRELHRQVTVMAAEGGFVPGYADHLKNVLTGKAVYIASGTMEELKKAAPYLPEGTIFFGKDDNTVERLEQLIGERAPGGFGLGGAVTVANLDEQTAPGFYAAANVEVDGETFSYVFVHVAAYGTGDRHAHQTMYTVGGGGHILHRNRYQGEWSAWEWDNPPLMENVEYRTTKRWNGKVLYAQRRMLEVAATGESEGNLDLVASPLKAVVVSAQATTSNLLLPILNSNSGDYNVQLDVRRSGAFTYKAGARATDTKVSVVCEYYKEEATT